MARRLKLLTTRDDEKLKFTFAKVRKMFDWKVYTNFRLNKRGCKSLYGYEGISEFGVRFLKFESELFHGLCFHSFLGELLLDVHIYFSQPAQPLVPEWRLFRESIRCVFHPVVKVIDVGCIFGVSKNVLVMRKLATA